MIIFRCFAFLFLTAGLCTGQSFAKPFVLAWEAAPRTIDPRYATDANSQYLENLVHCSLIDYGESGEIVNQLATKIEWKDLRTLVVTFNQAAKFSDGTAVTAEDIKATYDFFNDESVAVKSPRKGAFAGIEKITTAGNTITFQLKEPDSTFVGNLIIGILPQKLAKGPQLSKPVENVGCGPFDLKATGIAGLTLEKNKHYSLGAAPKLDSIQIKVVKDESTRFAKLRAGELDLVQNIISTDKLGDIATKYPHLKIKKRPGLNVTYLGFNMRDKVVGNIKVRQAISKAINRDAIIKYILNGYAIPASTMLPPTDRYYNSALGKPAYDPEAAKKLLDEAGYKDPGGNKPRLTLTYKTTTDTTRVAIAKAISSDLKKIGIEVEVRPLEWGRFKDDVEKGKVQMWSLSWIGFKDPDIFRYAFATESFIPNGGNRGWYSNPKMDTLMAEAKAEIDLAKRKTAYDKVQEIADEELPYVFLWHEEIFAVLNSKVEGFEVYADGRLASLTEVSLK